MVAIIKEVDVTEYVKILLSFPSLFILYDAFSKIS